MAFEFFNNKLNDYINACMCGYICGDRGTGKSTLFAFIANGAKKQKFNVYSNYPINDTFAIPTITTTRRNGSTRVMLDKDFLYSTDLSNSVILLDEARTIWNARAYNDWTIQDEEFFNFIRKNNTYVWLASQVFDGVDLNCRRAVEYTFFLQKIRWFPLLTKNFCSVDISRSVQLKVADRNTEVLMRGYARGAQKVNWDIGELPCAYTYFYRKPYYKMFNSLYTTEIKKIKEPILWNDIIKGEDTTSLPLSTDGTA